MLKDEVISNVNSAAVRSAAELLLHLDSWHVHTWKFLSASIFGKIMCASHPLAPLSPNSASSVVAWAMPLTTTFPATHGIKDTNIL